MKYNSANVISAGQANLRKKAEKRKKAIKQALRQLKAKLKKSKGKKRKSAKGNR